MALDHEQTKEVELLIERRTDLMKRIGKMEIRLSVLESLDAMAKSHDTDIRKLWLWAFGSVFTALIALIVAILQVFG